MNNTQDKTEKEVMGYFGNIWVKSHVLPNKGDTNGGGHKHHFDHVTLLIKGSVEVQVPDCPPKVFTAPTFIVIKKDNEHKFTALEDDTVYYCVFALRDIDGQPIDGDIVDEANVPYYSGLMGIVSPLTPPEHNPIEELQWLKGKTITEVLGK